MDKHLRTRHQDDDDSENDARQVLETRAPGKNEWVSDVVKGYPELDTCDIVIREVTQCQEPRNDN